MVDLFCSPPPWLTDSISHWPNPLNYGVGSLPGHQKFRGGTWDQHEDPFSWLELPSLSGPVIEALLGSLDVLVLTA